MRFQVPLSKRIHTKTFFKALARTEISQNSQLQKVKKHVCTHRYNEKRAEIRDLDIFHDKWNLLLILLTKDT